MKWPSLKGHGQMLSGRQVLCVFPVMQTGCDVRFVEVQPHLISQASLDRFSLCVW